MPRHTVPTDTDTGAPVDLYYEDHGSGRPVVLIHGWPLSGRAWEQQVPALVEAGHRVVVYDYDTLASDLHSLVEHLDLRDATLVGFSMGGGEVARYVGRYGTDRLRGVVLAAAVPPYLFSSDDNPDGGLDDATIAGFEQAVRADRLAFLDEFTRNFFSASDDLLVSEPLRQYALRIAAEASPKGTLDCIAAWGRTDFRGDLEKVDVPALVIHGDADGIVPFEVSGARSAASIEGSELVVVEGGPHGINTTHAQAFNEALLAFLAR